jgi:hypothetical protein
MNIALVLQHKLALGIQRLLHGDCLAQTEVRLHGRNHARPPAPHAPRLATAHGSITASATRHLVEKAMPLRVLRVVESDMPRSSTGRLVISGRMADVCAELDRLVECEAALH